MTQPAQQTPSTSASIELLLSALGETRAPFGAAFFRYRATERALVLDGYRPASATESVLFSAAAPHLLSGPSAVSRAARGLCTEYVPRYVDGSNGSASSQLPMSAHFIPVLRDEALFGVFAFFRRGEDAIAEQVRPLLELVAHIAAKTELAQAELGERTRGVEACFGRFVGEMGRLGFGPTKAAVRSGEAPLDTSLMTPREQEVLDIFLFHGEIGGIAQRLAISPHTVRNHLKAIYRKLGVHSQAELLRRLQFDVASQQ